MSDLDALKAREAQLAEQIVRRVIQIGESDIPPGEPGDTGRLLDAMLARRWAAVRAEIAVREEQS